MTNLYSLGDSDDNSFYVHASQVTSPPAWISMSAKHALKIGFDYRRIKAAGNDYNTGGGSYSFSGIFTASNATSTGTGGADLADSIARLSGQRVDYDVRQA